MDSGNARRESAILYRSNAQSRQFEEKLMAVGIPYRVYGGLRFFDRAEIKHAIAYLRLSAHRDDDPSFERVVNFPPRGIGARTLDQIRRPSPYRRLFIVASFYSHFKGENSFRAGHQRSKAFCRIHR